MNVLPLPPLTDDPATAMAHLDEFGVARLTHALDEDTLALLRWRVDEQSAAEAQRGVASFMGGKDRWERGGPNQWVFNLVNKGEVFRDLVLNTRAMEIVHHQLGKDFLLSSLNMHNPGKGGEPQALHTDGWMAPLDTSYPIVATIGWCLDDIDESNGATRVIPGSHRWSVEVMRHGVREENTVPVPVPAGGALLLHGKLWHGAGANPGWSMRRMILAYYCRAFVRQQENFSLSLAPEVYARCSEELLKLLGFSVFRTLGSMAATRPDFEGLVSRPKEFVTELRADGSRI